MSEQYLNRNNSLIKVDGMGSIFKESVHSLESQFHFIGGFHPYVLALSSVVPLSHKHCTGKEGSGAAFSVNRWTIRECWHLNGLVIFR